ncbi:hypothetical protein NPIL_478031 [Nephila pilipes]|uniref:Uncharacterized protein n=1 Tax=Nephila pilipes TaxID=299642 RepID=A0A8X6PVL8_NEPPI|nr:hypothetical protein NPIL_478031 [Nephila pilipes]
MEVDDLFVKNGRFNLGSLVLLFHSSSFCEDACPERTAQESSGHNLPFPSNTTKTTFWQHFVRCEIWQLESHLAFHSFVSSPDSYSFGNSRYKLNGLIRSLSNSNLRKKGTKISDS